MKRLVVLATCLLIAANSAVAGKAAVENAAYLKRVQKYFGTERKNCQSYGEMFEDISAIANSSPEFGQRLTQHLTQHLTMTSATEPNLVMSEEKNVKHRFIAGIEKLITTGDTQSWEFRPVTNKLEMVWWDPSTTYCGDKTCGDSSMVKALRWAPFMEGARLYALEKKGEYQNAAIFVVPVHRDGTTYQLVSLIGRDLLTEPRYLERESGLIARSSFAYEWVRKFEKTFPNMVLYGKKKGDQLVYKSMVPIANLYEFEFTDKMAQNIQGYANLQCKFTDEKSKKPGIGIPAAVAKNYPFWMKSILPFENEKQKSGTEEFTKADNLLFKPVMAAFDKTPVPTESKSSSADLPKQEPKNEAPAKMQLPDLPLVRTPASANVTPADDFSFSTPLPQFRNPTVNANVQSPQGHGSESSNMFVKESPKIANQLPDFPSTQGFSKLGDHLANIFGLDKKEPDSSGFFKPVIPKDKPRIIPNEDGSRRDILSKAELKEVATELLKRSREENKLEPIFDVLMKVEPRLADKIIDEMDKNADEVCAVEEKVKEILK